MKIIPSPLSVPITLRTCSYSEYGRLARFHYRIGPPGPVDKCFGLYIPSRSRISNEPQLIGIIVYSRPALNQHLRSLATGGRYLAVKDMRSRAQLLNRELRTIARVIIDPQFRSLGLAVALVRETLPLAGMPFVEASAAMGSYHPFFVKAGMTMYTAPPQLKHQLLRAAFEHVGIAAEVLLNPADALARLAALAPAEQRFLLAQIEKYYLTARQAAFASGTSTDWAWLIPRLAEVLFARPAYFLWRRSA